MKLTDIILNEIHEQKTQNYLKRQSIISAIENNEKLSTDYMACKNLVFEIAKSKHQNKDVSALENDYAIHKQNLHKNLNKLGFDLQFLKHPYSCKKCKDTGKLENGYCICYYNKLSERILQTSGLTKKQLPELSEIKFDFLKDKNEITKRQQLVKLLSDFVKKCDVSDKKSFVISGNVGVGKTHLLYGVVNESLKNNKFVVYTTAFNLNKDFLKYHCAKLEEKEDILTNYINCDILCIDDLGTENILKNVTCEYLFLILNERLIRGKSTVITTNLTLSQILEVYDERIYSRLKDKQTSIVVNLNGEDIRLIK